MHTRFPVQMLSPANELLCRYPVQSVPQNNILFQLCTVQTYFLFLPLVLNTAFPSPDRNILPNPYQDILLQVYRLHIHSLVLPPDSANKLPFEYLSQHLYLNNILFQFCTVQMHFLHLLPAPCNLSPLLHCTVSMCYPDIFYQDCTMHIYCCIFLSV